MRILGIDQSFTSCGFVIMDDSKQMLSFGRLTSNKEQLSIDRARWIVDEIEKLVREWQPTHVSFEGLALGVRMGDATRDLAGLMYMMWSTLRHQHGYVDNLHVVAPTTVKKHATGKGRAEKKDMIAALPDSVRDTILAAGYLKTKGLPDIADAYWMAPHALTVYQNSGIVSST